MRTAFPAARRNRYNVQRSLFCACGGAFHLSLVCAAAVTAAERTRGKSLGAGARRCWSATGISVAFVERPTGLPCIIGGRDLIGQTISLRCVRAAMRVHKLLSTRIWLPDMLRVLWAEQHPGSPVQQQFAFAA